MGSGDCMTLNSKMTSLADGFRARFNTKDKLGIDDMIKLITPPKQIVLVPAGSLKALYSDVDGTRKGYTTETYDRVSWHLRVLWYLDHDTYVSYKSMQNTSQALSLIKNGQSFTMQISLHLNDDGSGASAPINYWLYESQYLTKKQTTCSQGSNYTFELPVSSKTVQTAKGLSVIMHPDNRNFQVDLKSISITLIAK